MSSNIGMVAGEAPAGGSILARTCIALDPEAFQVIVLLDRPLGMKITGSVGG